jgi:iron complex transport system substrate-binding protein
MAFAIGFRPPGKSAIGTLMLRITTNFLAFFAVLALTAAPASAGKPQRIVSLNQCTDILLLMLVEPERIASISFVTRQKQWTPPQFTDVVRAIPTNRALAEEVIVLRPDLVVTGRYTGTQASALLRRLGVPVVEFEPESDFDDVRTNLRQMGEAVGETDRAEEIVAGFDAEIARLRAENATPRGVVADIGVNGWMSGEGVLTADALNLAGYRTLGQHLGIQGYGNLTLEQIVTATPDALAPLNAWTSPPSMATNAFRHPALRRLSQSVPVASIPERLTACGSPEVLKAAAILAQAATPALGGVR